MKVGWLLLPSGNYHPGKPTKLWIDKDAPLNDSDPIRSYLIYEVPVRTTQFVGIIVSGNPNGGQSFDPALIDATHMLDQTKLGTPDAVFEGTIVQSPAPVDVQQLVKNAGRDWKPFTKKGAPVEQLVDVWIDHPDVFSKYVDRRKDPGFLSRQNSFILMAWDTWNEQGLSLKERVADMKNQGFGDLEPKALEKRAKRLKLAPSKPRGGS